MPRRPLGAQRTKASDRQHESIAELDQGLLGFEMLMAAVRQALEGDDPALLMRLANDHVWAATHRVPSDGGPQMIPHHGIKNLAYDDRAEAHALLGAMSILYPDELDRGLASAAFSYGEHEFPGWVADLATLMIESAHVADDPLGLCEIVGVVMVAESCQIEVYVDLGTDPAVVHDTGMRTIGPGEPVLVRESPRCRPVSFNEIRPTLERAVRAADCDGHGPQGALPIVEWLLRIAPPE